MNLKEGLAGRAELKVGEADSAQAMGSGALPVLATPRLVALMEQAACAAIAPSLEAGQTSVGVWIEVEHLAATPLGMQVSAQAVLERIEGRTLHFALGAADARETIGSGRHRRVLIDAARFMGKAEAKQGKA